MSRTGSSTPPIERMVTPDAPVNGVKKASTRVVTTARPPGIQPTSALKSRMRRWLAPPSARMYPPSVNRGIAGSIGEVASRYVSVGADAIGDMSYQKSSSAAPPIAEKIGMPSAVATTMTSRPGVRTSNSCIVGHQANAAGIARPSRAIARPDQRLEAFHANRAPMTRKPTGITSRNAQTGMPQPTSCPNSRSAFNRSQLAAVRATQTPIAIALVKTRIGGPSLCRAESASSIGPAAAPRGPPAWRRER